MESGRLALFGLARLGAFGWSWRLWVAMAAERDLLAAIALPQLSEQFEPEQAARFAVALEIRAVRDRLVSAMAVAGPENSGAEMLWSRLVPVLPGRARTEAAVLLGLARYARGQGAAAQAALEAALDNDPGHELAQLLEACLFAGVPPSALEALA